MAVNISGSVTVRVEIEFDVDIDEEFERYDSSTLNSHLEQAIKDQIKDEVTYGYANVEILSQNLSAELDDLEVTL